jgi:hypothetical protein
MGVSKINNVECLYIKDPYPKHYNSLYVAVSCNYCRYNNNGCPCELVKSCEFCKRKYCACHTAYEKDVEANDILKAPYKKRKRGEIK